MTVEELIKQLSKYDKNTKAIIWDENEQRFSDSLKVDYDELKYYPDAIEEEDNEDSTELVVILYAG